MVVLVEIDGRPNLIHAVGFVTLTWEPYQIPRANSIAPSHSLQSCGIWYACMRSVPNLLICLRTYGQTEFALGRWDFAQAALDTTAVAPTMAAESTGIACAVLLQEFLRQHKIGMIIVRAHCSLCAYRRRS
jgi:hypothetical protein